MNQMPEFVVMDKSAAAAAAAAPPLGQDFFDSLDRVDESALARLEIELRLNTLQELPDLRAMFLARRQHYAQQYRNYAMRQYHAAAAAAQRRNWSLTQAS